MLNRSVLTVSLLAISAVTPVRADVLNFDDVNTGGVTAAMPSGYGGFTWDANWYVADNGWYNSTYSNTVSFPSAPNAAYNGFGVVTVSLNGSPFSFDGADFASWVANDSRQSFSSVSVTVDGYLNGNLVGQVTTDLAPDGSFTFLTASSAFNDVDSLQIVNDGVSGHWWLMDNFTFGAPITATPEPSSLIGLLTVLGGVGFQIRKKYQRQVD
jgi:hypothetical protein